MTPILSSEIESGDDLERGWRNKVITQVGLLVIRQGGSQTRRAHKWIYPLKRAE